MHNEEDDGLEELSEEERRRTEALTEGELRYLDEALLEEMDAVRWRKLGRVLFGAVKAIRDRVPDIPYEFAASRVRRMVSLGAVLSQGDLFQMRFCEVRLPDPKGDEEIAV